jgi:hypothetical protein
MNQNLGARLWAVNFGKARAAIVEVVVPGPTLQLMPPVIGQHLIEFAPNSSGSSVVAAGGAESHLPQARLSLAGRGHRIYLYLLRNVCIARPDRCGMPTLLTSRCRRVRVPGGAQDVSAVAVSRSLVT